MVLWQKTPETALPLWHVDPHQIHECLSPPHSPTQTTAPSVHALPHNYATNSPLVTMGCPKFTPKTVPFLRRSPPHLIHQSLHWPQSQPWTTSGSIQPFFTIHCPDKLTDKWSGRQAFIKSAYARERRTDNHLMALYPAPEETLHSIFWILRCRKS